MSSVMDINQIFAKNFEILGNRFPTLAEKIKEAAPFDVQTATSKDGGICYVRKNETGQWHALSNPQDPIHQAQLAVKNCEDRLGKGVAPAVVVGLNPGYVLEILYKHFKENYYDNYIPRRIYVVIDSAECLFGWLCQSDRSEILQKEEIEFYWKDEVRRIVRLCKKNDQRSHLFIPVSSLPEHVTLTLIDPLAKFFLERQEEEKKLFEENCRYYEKITDDELDSIFKGEAERNPRLMIPSHASSTVVQYSVRDTAAMFEKEGWDVKIIYMKTDLSRWRINKDINEFKPDIYMQVNHLRTENIGFYPPHLMFVTWVQDTVSYINNSESAKTWNDHVQSKKERRDIIIGYVGQIKQYGYQEDRLEECPMIVNQDIFKERELTAEEKAKYECDICFASNRSKETSLIVKEDLTPKLEKFGFTEDILMSIHDHLWEYYRDEKTCVGYVQLEDKIIELPEVCALIEKLINKDDHDFVIQRIYWELNDVIYRHIVLEWIDEMGDKKLHLYGRGWENHPKFSKYAKGILQHGEELALAYQSAKHCLHLNSLEGEHQRLNEIIDAGGTPLLRSILEDKDYARFQDVIKATKDLNLPNPAFLKTLLNFSEKATKQYPFKLFVQKVNDWLTQYRNGILHKVKLRNSSFRTLNELKLYLSQKFQADPQSFRGNRDFDKIIKFLTNDHKKSDTLLNESFLNLVYKLHNSTDDCSTQQLNPLEVNFLFSFVLKNIKREKLFKRFSKKIIPDLLISEYIPYYINYMNPDLEQERLFNLIQKVYRQQEDICDLFISLARKNLNASNWYDIACKDIDLQRLSVNGAAELATLSVKFADEKKVLNDIIIVAPLLKKPEQAEVSALLALFSQTLKVFDLKKLNYLTTKLPESISHVDINRAQKAALLENGFKADSVYAENKDAFFIYTLILAGRKKLAELHFNKDFHAQAIFKITFNAFKRNQEKGALKIFNFLNSHSISFKQSQVNLIFNRAEVLSKKQLLHFIKKAYLNNPELKDLYLKYSYKYAKNIEQKFTYAMRDLQEGKLTLDGAAKLIIDNNDSQNLKDFIRALVKYSSSLSPECHYYLNAVLPIFVEILKHSNKASLKKTCSSLQRFIPESQLLLYQNIALLEYGKKVNDNISFEQDKLIEEIYYHAIIHSMPDSHSGFNESKHLKILQRLAFETLKRNNGRAAFALFLFLLKNAPSFKTARGAEAYPLLINICAKYKLAEELKTAIKTFSPAHLNHKHNKACLNTLLNAGDTAAALEMLEQMPGSQYAILMTALIQIFTNKKCTVDPAKILPENDAQKIQLSFIWLSKNQSKIAIKNLPANKCIGDIVNLLKVVILHKAASFAKAEKEFNRCYPELNYKNTLLKVTQSPDDIGEVWPVFKDKIFWKNFLTTNFKTLV